MSAWQQELSAQTWATFKRATTQEVNGVFGDGRDFAFIRSSRGGTTGIDQRAGPGGQTTFNQSQRYDDPYFVQNINRATTAGLFAGPYHFARADILATTTNSDGTMVGTANTGLDDANHFLEAASAWMRPGFLLPVLDLEAGSARSTSDLSAFAVAFADRIYERMGVRPIIYVNSSYANSEVNSTVPAVMPNLWIARPSSGDPLTTEPPAASGYPNVYGVWNPSYPTIPTPQPWKFWQYDTTGGLNGYGGNLDKNAANGGMEFLRDFLIPALWVAETDGQWTALTNWNSGVPPAAPIRGPGQVAAVGTQTLPTPRLPGSNDTVILERLTNNVMITLSSNVHRIRKLFVKESLTITGGSLTITYIPAPDSTPLAAQFSGAVALGGSGLLNVHTLQVDATRTFTLGGGTLAFNTIALMPHSSTPARILVTNNMVVNPLAGANATIVRGSGAGNSGGIDFAGGVRSLNIGNGASETDLSLDVPLSNGGLTKAGLGTMRLSAANSYSGGTTISFGRLLVNNATGSGTGSGGVIVNGGFLSGTGRISGALSVNAGGTLAPGLTTSMGTLTFNNSATLGGATYIRVDRNGSLSDRAILTGGTLTYGGSLIVSNIGGTLTGGEVFTPFSAPIYAGAFDASTLPQVGPNLNWYLGGLGVNGTIKVNRGPVFGPVLQYTNEPGGVLEIPISKLISSATDADGDQLSLAGISSVSTNGMALQTNATSILYSNNMSVPDQFSYTLSDGRGGLATNVVNIIPSRAARFVAHPSSDGSSVRLRFAGQPGSTYHLERSTNLPIWHTIWTNVAPPSGVLEYTDALPPPPSQAFYQLRWSP